LQLADDLQRECPGLVASDNELALQLDLCRRHAGERISLARRIVTMINGGHATVYVSNMDSAIRFYTEILGLKLTNRFGNHWATVKAGDTLVIGLHPWAPRYPRPGTKGSVQIGLVLSRDEPIENLAARLRQHGVEVSDIKSEEANYISFEDPDGNPIYVADRDPGIDDERTAQTSVGAARS
jgi:catechol 2,3-dioxygenase-like lactoylglutathione lyase family enzyme